MHRRCCPRMRGDRCVTRCLVHPEEEGATDLRERRSESPKSPLCRPSPSENAARWTNDRFDEAAPQRPAKKRTAATGRSRLRAGMVGLARSHGHLASSWPDRTVRAVSITRASLSAPGGVSSSSAGWKRMLLPLVRSRSKTSALRSPTTSRTFARLADRFTWISRFRGPVATSRRRASSRRLERGRRRRGLP